MGVMDYFGRVKDVILHPYKKRSDYSLASVRNRLKYWNTSRVAPTASITDQNLTRSRARGLVRNNAHAFKFKTLVATKIVSKGFKPSCASDDTITRWEWWAKKAKRCDADEKSNFLAITTTVMQAVAESGAVLVRRIWKESEEVPMELQVLEIDFLDDTVDGEDETTRTIHGIRFLKRTNKRLGYNIFNAHPLNADISDGSTSVSSFVEAKDILHIYRQERPGSIDGMTWFAPFANDLKEFADYRDAQLMKQKISACHVGMIHDMEMPELGDITEEENTFDLEGRLEPGLFDYLPPGKDITFNNPPRVDGFDEYDFSTMKSIATGSGFSYESMTGDYSRVNFTSGRMGQLNERAFVELMQSVILVPQLLDPVWDWFIEALVVAGHIKEGEIEVTWTPPKVPFVNPVQDINALVTEVDKGFKTHSEALRERGKDPKEFIKEKNGEAELVALFEEKEVTSD